MLPPILVVGETGQLARALKLRLKNERALFSSKNDLDLSSPKITVERYLDRLGPFQGVIIAAAYTAVDLAEIHQKKALSVNGTAPRIIADYCRTNNIPLVHVSTDYVFSGNGIKPYKTFDEVNPVNHYGVTKLIGEKAVLESGANAAILRTSWVFDGYGKNFLTTMLRLSSNYEKLTIVGDQIGRPTYAGHLADACLKALSGISDNTFIPGIYHVTGGGAPCSWAHFAEEIFKRTTSLRNNKIEVIPIASSDYPTKAKRPQYSVLDLSKYETMIRQKLPDWKIGLDIAIKDYMALHS